MFMVFGGFNFLFIVVLAFAGGSIIRNLRRGLRDDRLTRRINDAPTLSVAAAVVKKAQWRSAFGAATQAAVFEVESGDRLEFALDRASFDRLSQDDVGKLTFRGDEFVSFAVNDRTIQQ